jgi:hypothetical protein
MITIIVLPYNMFIFVMFMQIVADFILLIDITYSNAHEFDAKLFFVFFIFPELTTGVQIY